MNFSAARDARKMARDDEISMIGDDTTRVRDWAL